MSTTYERAMAEVITELNNIIRKSPEHGNAVMDILEDHNYKAIQNLAGRQEVPFDVWQQEREYQLYLDRVESRKKLREIMKELEDL